MWLTREHVALMLQNGGWLWVKISPDINPIYGLMDLSLMTPKWWLYVDLILLVISLLTLSMSVGLTLPKGWGAFKAPPEQKLRFWHLPWNLLHIGKPTKNPKKFTLSATKINQGPLPLPLFHKNFGTFLASKIHPSKKCQFFNSN